MHHGSSSTPARRLARPPQPPLCLPAAGGQWPLGSARAAAGSKIGPRGHDPVAAPPAPAVWGPKRAIPSPPRLVPVRLRCAELPSARKPGVPSCALPPAPWRGERRLNLRGGGGAGGGVSSRSSPRCHCRCCEGCSGGAPVGEAGGGRASGGPSMKSLLLSRFLVLLPWVLLVIIMLDTDGSSRAHPPSAAALARRPQQQQHEGAPRRREAEAEPPPPLPIIYAITPTYSRPVQKAELTRLANTFRQVARLHWILVEDSAVRTELVSRFVAGLSRGGGAGPPCTHLHVLTPRRYKRPGLPRATEQRNAGLAWIRQRHQHVSPPQPGVLFFADDDNTYSLELFQEVAWGGEGGAGWLAGYPPSLAPGRGADPQREALLWGSLVFRGTNLYSEVASVVFGGADSRVRAQAPAALGCNPVPRSEDHWTRWVSVPFFFLLQCPLVAQRSALESFAGASANPDPSLPSALLFPRPG